MTSLTDSTMADRKARPVLRFDWQVALWLVLLALAIAVSCVPVDGVVQLAGVGVLYLTGLVLSARARSGVGLARTFALFCCAVITLRYFVWRTTSTLGYHDLLSFISAILLYGAEVYGICLFLMSLVTTAMPIERRREDRKIDLVDPRLPRVDVVIPTYNESEGLLRITVAAAVSLNYPADKLRIHLLDDGGTVQKRNQADPEKAREAWERHEVLQRLCAEFGAFYHTRERNEHAKSGNINAALPSLEGDLIMVIDADHVPTVDFLEWTVDPFLEDPKLFLVQTPHFFINPDPLEKNLRGSEDGPAESAMFYRLIMKGMDYWNATIFCGSAALLRRTCIMEIGGFAQDTITEDAETAMEMHARGYNSAYIDRPLIAGLSAENFESFLIQRSRWGVGMLQMLILKKPLTRKGLSLAQRLCYFSSTVFWFFPIPRAIFMLAPILYLLFHLRVYDTNTTQFLVYVVPHILASALAANILFGRFRWPLVSTVYETMLSLLMLRAVIGALISPRAPLFKVTPKGTVSDKDFVSPLARPSYLVFSLVAGANIAGVIRIIYEPYDIGVLLVTMAWNTINLFVLIMAVGAMMEQRQRRNAHRIEVNIPALVELGDGSVVLGRLCDFSSHGAQIELDQPVNHRPEHIRLRFKHLAYDRPAVIGALVRAVKPRSGGRQALGLEFECCDAEAWREVVTLVYGASQRWDEIWCRESRPVSIFRVLYRFLWVSLRMLRAHAGEIVRDVASIMVIDARRLYHWLIRTVAI